MVNIAKCPIIFYLFFFLKRERSKTPFEMYFADAYLSHINEIITDGKRTFLRLVNGLIYDLNQKKVVFRLRNIPEKCAIRDNFFVYVYGCEIYVYDLETEIVRKFGVHLSSNTTDISFKQGLIFGCSDGRIFIFDENLVFRQTLNIDKTPIISLLETRIGLIISTRKGTLAVYIDGVLRYRILDINLLSMAVWDEHSRVDKSEKENLDNEQDEPQILKLPPIKQNQYNDECCDVEIIDDLEHIETVWKLSPNGSNKRHKMMNILGSEFRNKEESNDISQNEGKGDEGEAICENTEDDPNKVERNKEIAEAACEKIDRLPNKIERLESSAHHESKNSGETPRSDENTELQDKKISCGRKNADLCDETVQNRIKGDEPPRYNQETIHSPTNTLQKQMVKKLSVTKRETSSEQNEMSEKQVMGAASQKNNSSEMVKKETEEPRSKRAHPGNKHDDSDTEQNISFNNDNSDIEIIVGDTQGYLYFIDPFTFTYRRKYISSTPIESLFFSDFLYCIVDGFVRKINKNGDMKIYGTVGDMPIKIFKFGRKMFCTGVWGGILPLNDREDDFFEKIIMKHKQSVERDGFM